MNGQQPQQPKLSEQSTHETFNDYYPGNVNHLLRKMESTNEAISRSRQRVQQYLQSLVRKPAKEHHSVATRVRTQGNECATSMHPYRMEQRQESSAGRIRNQSDSLKKYMRERSRGVKPEHTPPPDRYLLNQQIIALLLDSIEQEKKSNRIFKKQLKAKQQLLCQLRHS